MFFGYDCTNNSQSPPDAVTPSDRVAADEILVAFRQSKQPFDACRNILGVYNVLNAVSLFLTYTFSASSFMHVSLTSNFSRWARENPPRCKNGLLARLVKYLVHGVR